MVPRVTKSCHLEENRLWRVKWSYVLRVLSVSNMFSLLKLCVKFFLTFESARGTEFMNEKARERKRVHSNNILAQYDPIHLRRQLFLPHWEQMYICMWRCGTFYSCYILHLGKYTSVRFAEREREREIHVLRAWYELFKGNLVRILDEKERKEKKK